MSDSLLTQRFEDALVLAVRLHTTQARKGTSIPYMAHLMAVSALVMEHGGTEDEAIAALLHDAVEDCGGAPVLAQIRERFGDGVAATVDGCTDAYVVPKPPWHQRKQGFVRRMSDASASVRLVACADKLHNAQATLRDYRVVGEVVWDRFSATKSELLWYYRALADVFLERGPALLARELDRVVSALESEVPT